MRWERRDERNDGVCAQEDRTGDWINDGEVQVQTGAAAGKPTAIWQAGWATGERVRRAGGLGMVGRCWAGGWERREVQVQPPTPQCDGNLAGGMDNGRRVRRADGFGMVGRCWAGGWERREVQVQPPTPQCDGNLAGGMGWWGVGLVGRDDGKCKCNPSPRNATAIWQVGCGWRGVG